MSLIKFLTSKVFIKQLLLAIVAVVVLCFLVLKWLKITTNHNEFETVPELKGKTIEVAEMELEDNDLVMEIQDSANYNPKYPKGSVIEQNPLAGSKVKESRKVYVILNPSGYRKVSVPDLRQRTYRQAKPTLEALGFTVGKITYQDNIGKDMVLGLRYKGSILKPGTMLEKTSVVDLVLGNGKRPSNN